MTTAQHDWILRNPEKMRKARKAWRENNREHAREYHRSYKLRRRRQRRAFWMAELGGACARCGGTKDLHFDHIDPSTKVEEPARAINNWPDARLEEEMSKCQLLCASCHGRKTRTENEREEDDDE